MKILESQNAVMTNYEVLQHLMEVQFKYRGPRKPPSNLKTVMKDVMDSLRTAPNPLSQRPITYDADCIGRLMKRLQSYNLSKGEVIMILNLRPANGAILNVCIEDMQTRFTDEKQNDMIDIVAEVLGQFPPNSNEAAEYGEDGAP